MRSILLALIAAVTLLAPPAATAAPTCQDHNGDTIRCGTAGAMPVGWTLPAGERLQRHLAEPPGPSFETLLGLGCFLVGFFALIALLPDFDGRWDREEGDDEKAG
ncbi:MAG TPA: hypothetical protein VHZ26_19935 [Caulobacteraceae bacterium]|jgi:hypothetical protein|nr:hypothetical protein [Caulobacteraceae bacterium]